MGKIIVLGVGNMGAYISSSLAAEHDVTVVDYSQANLDKITDAHAKKVKTDLSDLKNVEREVANFDLVVSALPESFGYAALKAVITAGKDVVDISFWEQGKKRLSELESLAKKHNVTVFIDCGIAPGFSNGLVEFFDKLLVGKTKNASIYVGGIPKERKKGFFAPWSISGLVEEYQRKALCVRNNKRKRVEALLIVEKIIFPRVGELEGAITDGLRTLPDSLGRIRNMSEFTLRYPGHFYQMKLLKNLGYFNENLISVSQDKITAYELSQILLKRLTKRNMEMDEKVLADLGFYDKTCEYDCINKKVSPRRVAISVLSKRWKMSIDDRDVLVMRVQADDGKTQHTADVYAEHDGISSAMALTTGGMAALAARAIITRKFGLKGVFPVEKAVKEKPELLQYFSNGLQKLGVLCSQKKRKLYYNKKKQIDS